MFNRVKAVTRAIAVSAKYRWPKVLAGEMKQDWDGRASANAMGHINTAQPCWEAASFFATGEADVQQQTGGFFTGADFDPTEKCMLEIGCGIGRMTRAFARRFRKVYVLDVSEEMIRQGRELHASYDNIIWTVGSGIDLGCYRDAQFDFCFSYIVFQHIPTEQAIFSYVREIGRVLRPGGLFKFQVQNLARARRFAVVESKKVPWLKRKITVTAQHYDTWGGAYVDEGRLRRELARAKLHLLDLTGQGTRYMWAAGRKT